MLTEYVEDNKIVLGLMNKLSRWISEKDTLFLRFHIDAILKYALIDT